ncbi:hypothetical protein BGX31_009753 [Mortierella sp. GBA43]|nr:hypothetical protein BGX31_009753 [Mortierella sp. GBA43]
MSLPAVPVVTRPQPLVVQKECHSCTKQIPQAKVYAEPGKPSIIYCEKCYVEKFTKGNCPTCSRPVMSKTDPYITYNKQTWHAACFTCFSCSVDVASNPMVDLRGRPCCESCLMSQAGTGYQEHEPTSRNSFTPGERSLSGSPAPNSTFLQRTGRTSLSHMDGSLDGPAPHPLYLPPLNLSMDPSLIHPYSPRSATSSSPSSSLGESFRNNPSSGSNSGASSAHSSIGRKLQPSSNINLHKADQGLSAENTHLSYGRPGSSLSVHSYNSSRSESPLPGASDGTFKPHGLEGPSELSYPGSHRRSVPGMDDLGASVSRAFQNSNGRVSRSDTDSQENSQPGTPGRKSPVIDRYPTSSVTDVDLVRPTEKLSISTTSGPTPTAARPIVGRARSRSSVGISASMSVRARTEAFLNQVQTGTSPTTSRSSSQNFSNGSFTGSKNLGISKQPTSPAEKESKESKPAMLEAEPSRPSLFRHGRQRSNTVGEAVTLPVVSVEEAVSPAMSRTRIPEGHCHKCLEKVTENGVRLQNGDRYHIACFLCHGCKQIFTESEFHIVLGRPYHPGCVSMAGPSSIMGTITKCNKCQKVIANKSIRFSGSNYHPQCFTCSHCDKVLNSASRFFEVDGQVECEKCCDERDNVRLPPKVVPAPRNTDHFPMSVVVPSMDNNNRRGSVPLEPSGPASGKVVDDNLSRSGSGSSYGSLVNANGKANNTPGSPTLSSPGSAINLLNSQDQHESGNTSPVVMMASPLVKRNTPLTSFFSSRTSPLPKFGGTVNCPRCSLAVGVMDQVPGPKNEKWHKKCLNCVGCKKVLDSSALTRGPGEVFCRGCYNKARVAA